jgi:hypothetical protein
VFGGVWEEEEEFWEVKIYILIMLGLFMVTKKKPEGKRSVKKPSNKKSVKKSKRGLGRSYGY